MDYKNTINLLETPFPMRGDMVKREPGMLKKWDGRYKKLRSSYTRSDLLLALGITQLSVIIKLPSRGTINST